MVITFKVEDSECGEDVGATKLRTECDLTELREFGASDPTLIEDFGWQRRSVALRIAREYKAKFFEL